MLLKPKGRKITKAARMAYGAKPAQKPAQSRPAAGATQRSMHAYVQNRRATRT